MTSDLFAADRRTLLFGLAATIVPLRPAAAQTASPAPKADGAPGSEPRIVLRAVKALRKLVPDAESEAETLAFEGLGPGGVIRVRHGEEVFVRLRNDTELPLSLHWQGVRIANAMDGIGGLTQAPVSPGATFDYRFTPPDPGTYLVRPLVLGGSGEPAGRGLAALLIVEERDAPPVAAEYALIVRDWRLEPSGALAPFGAPLEAALGGRLGNRLSVEGRDAPRRIEVAPGARLRVRLANASNGRIMRIRFDDLKVVVAGVDGQPTEVFQPLRSALPFPPGTRYDLFIDAPTETGAKGAITALLGDGLPLVEIAAGAGAAAQPGAPAPLAPNLLLPPEIKLQNAVRREVDIAGGATRNAAGEPVYTGDPKAVWTIGKVAGASGIPPLLTAKRGQPVVVGLRNTTPFPQPMHLHGHVFRLLHALDDGWEPYWLDTLQVPEGKTSHIAFMADNPGKWLLGSTVLERLDTGLWTWIEVT